MMSGVTRPILHIYCDGGGVYGFGHIRRSLTLAHRFEKDGFVVSVIGLSQEAKKFLPAVASQSQTPQVAIFDCPPGVGIDALKGINPMHSMTVALDWFNSEALPFINISIFPHHPVLSLRKSFVGLEYVLIRPEIQNAKIKKNFHDGEYVFVSIGGSDLLNQGGAISNQLAVLGYSVLLVRGPMHHSCTSDVLATEVRVEDNPSDFSELMARSKFVVSNGGGCLFEALYLGKAVLAMPQTPFEQRIIEFLQVDGGILGCGVKDLKRFSESEIASIGAKGEKLIDGYGAERISSIVVAELGVCI